MKNDAAIIDKSRLSIFDRFGGSLQPPFFVSSLTPGIEVSKPTTRLETAYTKDSRLL